MNIKKINDEVFYTCDGITKISNSEIEFLKNNASGNRRKRVRLCCHRDTENLVHEMLVVLAKGTYIRPHKHLNKSESFHIIAGNLKVIIFEDSGGISEVIPMGDYSSTYVFYYRLSEDFFHTVIPVSEFVVFHESTQGPFRAKDTLFASWAPGDDEYEAQVSYMKILDLKARS